MKLYIVEHEGELFLVATAAINEERWTRTWEIGLCDPSIPPGIIGKMNGELGRRFIENAKRLK